MGLLGGGMAAVMSGVFSGIYLDGLLYRPNDFADDGAGGGSGGGFAAPEPIKVQIEAATQAMRAEEGFVDTDQRILVLAHGVAAITTDCEIVAGGSRWSIASVGRDAALAYYDTRGRRKASA